MTSGLCNFILNVKTCQLDR